MTPFEKAVVEEVKRVRASIADNTDVHNFCFEVSATGRAHDGEILIQFRFGEYSGNVSANSVDAALREFEHRNSFNKRNSGLVLTGPGEVENDDIPF